VKYKEIFVGFKSQWVPEGSIGCALTCAPYLVLAKNAVPSPVSDLLEMSLSQWQAFVAPQLMARGSDR
jgi:histidine decarboxylase